MLALASTVVQLRSSQYLSESPESESETQLLYDWQFFIIIIIIIIIMLLLLLSLFAGKLTYSGQGTFSSVVFYSMV
jgi:uncharacterized membrane protein YwaF